MSRAARSYRSPTLFIADVLALVASRDFGVRDRACNCALVIVALPLYLDLEAEVVGTIRIGYR